MTKHASERGLRFMKTLRKIGAIVLAIMMIAVVGLASASAVEETSQDTNKKTDGKPNPLSSAGVVDGTTSDGTKITGATAQDNTVRIFKEIVMFNAKANTPKTVVYLPNITYNYTIAGANVTDNSKYITDEFGSKILIQDGVDAALSTKTASVAYSATNGISSTSGSASAVTISTTPYISTNTAGEVARGYFDITFDVTKFPHAGVYRYVITEATTGTNDRAAAGIYNYEYTNTRYLDVYVMNDPTETEGADTYQIYGYVLFDGTADTEFNGKTATADLTQSTSGKTNGFVSNTKDGATGGYTPNEDDVDLYYTYNLKIEKQVDGALGDKTNEFPFQVDFTNSTITTAAKFTYRYDSVDGSSAEPTTKTFSSGTATIGSATATVADSFSLKDDEYIYVYGIPSYAYNSYTGVTPVLTTAVVTEYNNTYDIYKVGATFNNTQDATLVGTATMASTATAATTSTDSLITTDMDVFVVTNTIDAVSPTGYVTRFAPYVLILIGGVALLIIAIKRRKHTEEE